MTVQEACKDIREKLGEEVGAGADHGLFWPDNGKWLEPKRTLDFYDLKSSDQIEYKKKHRPLRVKMMDDTIKTILVDDSFNVQQLVQTVCNRIGIATPDEFSFTTEALQNSAKIVKDVKSKTPHHHQQAGELWLNPDKSLREQGVDESEVLLLKKKFFFSDSNVDRNDPIQLNLLYVQAQEAIVKGTHPCTMDEASQFAALQMQVQFGNHEPDKHKPGFLPMDQFVAPEYVKKRSDIEKKILQEHRKLQGMSELNAKFRYVQLCRSLKTYGVTFFEVKEKVPKKNKMLAILLGVTRDSVLRVDAETKEVLKVWPLTSLRRWAASPNSFTLDFGDYEDSYYTIQTPEGDAISQLIAGYIDIILKKRKEADRIVNDDETELAVTEDMILPGQATAISVVPGKAGHAMEVNIAQMGQVYGSDPNSGISMSHVQNVQFANMMGANAGMQIGQRPNITSIGNASGAQQGVLQHITGGFAAVNAAQSDLSVATTLPPLGTDPASVQWRKQTMEINKQNVISQMASHLAAAASIINLTAVDPEKMNLATISTNISTLTTDLTQLASGAKMVAALMDNQQDADHLLEYARGIASATQKLLAATQPVIMGEGNRQDLLGAAQLLGLTSGDMIKVMGDADVSADAQQELIDLAKAVTLAMTETVGTAKAVAAKTADPKEQQEVVSITKQTATAAAQLLSTTNVVAATINSPLCQEQLVQSAALVEFTLGALVSKAKVSCSDKDAVIELGNKTDRVRAALTRLVEKARMGGLSDEDLSELDRQVDLVLTASQALLDNSGSAAALISAAKNVAVTSTNLVNALRKQAETESDPAEKERLLAAARALADATQKMVAAAKDAARNPNDPLLQARLRASVEAVEESARSSAGADNKRKAFKKLVMAAKANAASATQLISAAKAAAPSNRNQAAQMQLIGASKAVGENAGALVSAVRAVADNPEDISAQLRLMNAAKASLGPGATLIAAAKAASPTVGDQAAQAQLLNFAKATSDSLRKLKDAYESAETVAGGLEMESALEAIEQARKDNAAAQALAKQGKLSPLADQTAESTQLETAATAKIIGTSLAQLLSAASQGNENYTGVAARDTAAALAALTASVRGVAATSNDRDVQNQVLANTASLLVDSEALIAAAQACVDDPNNTAKQQRLLDLASAVNTSMASVVDSMPSQRDVARSIENMQSSLKRLDKGIVKDASMTYMSARNFLSSASSAVNVAAANVVTLSASRASPEDLANGLRELDAAFDNLVTAGLALNSQTNDEQVKADVLNYMNDVFGSTSKLLQASQAFNADPNGPNLRHLMQLAAKGVADSIGKLMSVCTTAAPGQKEITSALHNLDASLGRLHSINQPSENNETYAHTVRHMVGAQANLLQSFSAVPASAKTGNGLEVGISAAQLSDNINALTEANMRAAYLIGASDPNSVAAVPGLIDQIKIAQSVHEITEAVEQLRDPGSSTQSVLSAAAVIARNTSALCNLCKTAATKTPNPVARNQFIASAKTVAGATGALVTNIKVLSAKPKDASARDAAYASARPLLEAVNNLKTFADSPEFAGTPAYMSPMAQASQEPLLRANRDAIEATRAALNSALVLCASPSDADTMRLFNSHAKIANDAVKHLVHAAKNAAPGQRECDNAIERVQNATTELDAAYVQVEVNSDLPATATSDDEFNALKDRLVDNARAISSSGDIVTRSSRGLGNLGAAVTVMAGNFEQLTANAISAAERVSDPRRRLEILDKSRTLGEIAAEMLIAAKGTGGTPADENAAQTEGNPEFVGPKLSKAAQDLAQSLEGSTAHDVEVNNVIAAISSVMENVDDLEDAPTNKSYMNLSEDVTAMGRELATTISDLVKARNPEDAVALASVIGERYGRLVRSAKGAAATSGEDDLRFDVLDSVRALGGVQVRLLEAVKASLANPTDMAARAKIVTTSRETSSAVATLVNSVKAGQKGVFACEESIHAIDDIIHELDTAIVFANAGTLDPEDKSKNFSAFTDVILNDTKDLTEIVKGLVGAVTGTQNQLAQAASNSVVSINALKDSIRHAAAAVTSADRASQDQLLTTVRSLAVHLQEHIKSSMRATSRRPNDVNLLKESAKAIITQINEMLRVVRSVSEDSSRATRAIDNTIEGINAAIVELKSDNAPQGTALPSDVVKEAQLVASAAAALVTSTSQEEVINASGNARKHVEDLLRTSKAALANAPKEKRAAIDSACAKSAEMVVSLLKTVKAQQTSSTPATKAEVQKSAKVVAESVNKVVEAANQLVPTGYVDPNDPNVIAERELLAAASSIEAAARKLAQMKPREDARLADEDLPFEEQILEAAKAIAGATAALVRSATAAQREIVAAGKVAGEDEKVYFSDGTWNDGLVSAAKHVASSTGELCDAANDAVQGKAEREKVIASAKAVSASTAQLLSAATVKADASSDAANRLRAAGSGVTRATKALISAAEQAAAFDETPTVSELWSKDMSGVQGKKAQIQAYEDILKAERMLEEARRKYKHMNEAQYKAAGK